MTATSATGSGRLSGTAACSGASSTASRSAATTFWIIAVLALVELHRGLRSGDDRLAAAAGRKAPLQLIPTAISVGSPVGPTLMLCMGGFASSAISDHWSRKTIMLIGVVATTFCTLLVPLVQSADQLIIVRLLTGLGAGGAISAAFPIAAELMPAQHRRTYGAIYEMSLAASFTVVPVYRRAAPRQHRCLSASRIARRAGDNGRAGADLFRAAGEPALVLAQRSARDRGRYRQPDHPPVRRPRAAVDRGGARRP